MNTIGSRIIRCGLAFLLGLAAVGGTGVLPVSAETFAEMPETAPVRPETGDTLLPTNTPRPEVVLFSDDIPSESAALSLQLYNDFLGYDPELFLLTDEGIKHLGWNSVGTDEDLAYLEEMAYSITEDCGSTNEKIFAVVEYVAQNVGYDYDYYTHGTKEYSELALNPWDVLEVGATVCEGYARTTEALLQILDIPCVYADSPNHKWNMVYNGERWMLIDVTWISESRYEYGMLEKSENLGLTWYDFTIEDANAEYNHLIEELALSVIDGVLTSFPAYTEKTDVVIPPNVHTIGDYTYITEDGGVIESIYLPKSVKAIGEAAFYYGDTLETIRYQGTKSEFSQIAAGRWNNNFTGCRDIRYLDEISDPYITGHPADVYTGVGEPVTLSAGVSADAGTITYQWYESSERCTDDGTPVEGAVTDTLAFTPEETGETYYYLEATVTDPSVSGTKEKRVTTVPCKVRVFEKVPSEILTTGPDTTVYIFEEDGAVYLEGSGKASFDLREMLWSKTLRKITVAEENTDYYVDSYGALIDAVGKRVVLYPNGNEYIEEYIVPDGIRHIDRQAFMYAAIGSVVFSDDLISIGAQAFYNINTISSYVFPASLNSVGYGAFAYNQYLTDVYFMGDVPEEWGSDIFHTWEDYGPVTIHYANTASGWNTPVWTDPADGTEYPAFPFDPEIYESGYACGDCAYWSYEDGVLTIAGEGSMWNWSYYEPAPWSGYAGEIEKIIISSGITAIGDYAFRGLASVVEAEIPKTVTAIGSYAFYGTSALKSVLIPENTDTIGDYAFYNSGITAVYFAGDVPENFGTYVLRDPRYLTIYYRADQGYGWTSPVWLDPNNREYPTATFVLQCGHTAEPEIRDAAKETCGSDGYTGDTYCTDCGEMIAAGKMIPATGRHTGGEATCRKQALCVVCGSAYGEADPRNHEAELKYYAASEATCIKTGNAAHWNCSVCGVNYSDAEGKSEAGTVEIPVDENNHVNTEIRDAVKPGDGQDGYTGDTWCIDCGKKTAEGEAYSYITGDISGDGKVNRADLILLSRYFAGDADISEIDVEAADVNHDGTFNRADLIKMKKYFAGSIDSLE